MDLDGKFKQFSDTVLKEAYKERDEILEKIQRDYKNGCEDFQNTNTTKYHKRFDEDQNGLQRDKQKVITVEQNNAKIELINKRNAQTKYVFANVLTRLEAYMDTQEYVDALVNGIHTHKSNQYPSKVYLVARDMKYKDLLQEKTGVEIIESSDDFVGGFKITISEYQLLDLTYETIIQSLKESFNKIKIG